jgi:glucose-6-phosphate isomerase
VEGPRSQSLEDPGVAIPDVTEKRAVLHLALRAPKGQAIVVDGEDVMPGVHAVLDKMADFSRRMSGRSRGSTVAKTL